MLFFEYKRTNPRPNFFSGFAMKEPKGAEPFKRGFSSSLPFFEKFA
jgi:hypothetical protein